MASGKPGAVQSASAYLKTLVEVDILKELKVGREKLFINPRLLQTLSIR
ncbi:hypothetical protein [Lichenifustis flavocetrariae]|uniref:Adenylyltransferase SoFic-like C-terminal domain-containing protein n=1 Tax=Lichenifustis flavocetrariae TaxID=2949735 RepID=A0AA42CLX6_9HYPH|nr:hypothetical protein [Lichenifustis flavocetrariae]MCW6507847.1 hypothetical protein [Lichenifustis flavocetrariae]